MIFNEKKEIYGVDIKGFYVKIAKKNPVIHCITNIVSANDCANILLAMGASPVMAQHVLDAGEISGGCDALVCNFGATGAYDAMYEAAKSAALLKHPIVADPVGVGASAYRRSCFLDFISKFKVSCIRGNISEIRALHEKRPTARGVDVSEYELKNNSGDESVLFKNAEWIREFSLKANCIVVCSGETDIVTDGKNTVFVTDGCSLMSRVSATGCMASAVTAAFLSVENSFISAAASISFMGRCGEYALKHLERGTSGIGSGSFRVGLIDAAGLIFNE